ncbi:MAG: transcriptional regulator [Candidatus Jordarchaeum sp.]|uniref:transcriptional regulator n=1 Tax=Candidatus Jordarchaeum sp. TaxID=2823881 RepID=UPI00404ACD14
MKSPCEIVIWYVLPSVRSELAKELVKLGLSQKEVANKLGISEAAVSHYVKGKRGKKIDLDKDTRNEVKKLASDMAFSSDHSKLILKTCEICIKFRRSDLLCKLHKSLEPVPADCKICSELFKEER